jgi:glycosyltransferase involved in cell wall biosynthesis
VQVGVYKLPVFNFAMRDIKISLPSRYILFIGRVREYKGIPLLVEAFENLENQDLKLIIAGEGNLEGLANPAVERIARWLDESEIAQLINQAEVVVFPYI